MPTTDETFGDLISAYSRAQAIADGVLVDVTETAREAGIKVHTCLTRGAWEEYVEVPPGCEGEGQSIRGRLWDVVYMARVFAVPALVREAMASGEPTVRRYGFSYLSAGGRRTASAKAHLGYGDRGEAVLTVMLPEED